MCGCKNAVMLCDPTMLLDVDCYRNLYQNDNIIPKNNQKYLLLHIMHDNKCNLDVEEVYNFAHERNLEILYVIGNIDVDNKEKIFPTIPEWLCLIDNAEYIVTNSFHCCVFSLLFQKKFAAVPLCGSTAEMNSRIETLCEMFGVQKRWFENNFEMLETELVVKSKLTQSFDIEKILNV